MHRHSSRRTLTILFLLAVTVCGGPMLPARADSPTAVHAALYRESYRLEAQRDYRAALDRLREIRGRGDRSYYLTLRLAWISYLLGDFASSETLYREAATDAQKAIEPRLGLTLPLLAEQKWRELERACRDVLALSSVHSIARARLAHALYMEGNYPDAASLYRRLLEEYPAELDYQTGLAWAMLKMARRAEARAMFQAVLAVSPDNVSAKGGLAATS